MKPTILSLFFLFFGSNGIQAQVTTPKNTVPKDTQLERLFRPMREKPFGLHGSYQTIDGKTLDFGNLSRPAFVCFGFYGCHPCMHELPVFIEAANTHPEVDFVYITFDSEQTRQREFEEVGMKDYKPAKNYYIIHIDRAEIDKAKVTLGYPTKYILSQHCTVRFFESGGNPSAPVTQIKTRIDDLIAQFAVRE